MFVMKTLISWKRVLVYHENIYVMKTFISWKRVYHENIYIVMKRFMLWNLYALKNVSYENQYVIKTPM